MSSKISNNILSVFNPANGKNLDSIQMTRPIEVDSILDSSKDASKIYNYSNFFHRKKLIHIFRKKIAQNMNAFIDIICNETGKKSVEALMEVFISLEHIDQLSKNLYEALGKRTRRAGLLKTRKVWVEYEAMGVAGIISPWNYPLILTLCPLVEALLSGNTVVLKPSEQTPLTTQLLKTIWDESTNRPELFQPIYGNGEVGKALVDTMKTDVICFTGSTDIGRKIAQSCATQFKPVILELGGKDPMIILEDADIDRSVSAAIWGGFSNAGQTCISVERIFVHKSIYTEIVEKISEKVRNLSSGLGNSLIGAITLDSNIKKIKEQIDDIRNSTEIIEGTCDSGWFIPPTLIIDPPFESKIINNEIFGPVITIHSFKSIEEAIRLANMTGYGLSASIFGNNKRAINFISRRLNVGAVSVNDVLTHYGISDLPFGGKGLSGIGKVHGREGLRAFSHQKSYMSSCFKLRSELWWYKSNEKFGLFLKKWIKWKYS